MHMFKTTSISPKFYTLIITGQDISVKGFNFCLTISQRSHINKYVFCCNNCIYHMNKKRLCHYIIPIEVKSERNNKAKSLAEYRKRFNPKLSVKTSMNNVAGTEVRQIPLYLLWQMKKYLSE